MLTIQAIIRGIIPFAVMTLIAVFLYYDNQIYNAKSTFLVGLIISIVAGASVIYDLNHLSLAVRTLIHFIVMLVTIYPILIFSGWFNTTSFIDYIIIFTIFLFTGIILWILIMIIQRVFLDS
ncbi:DUF3021 family protein [Salinicoccus sp. HZC-1]|uniref:DUF3021 family protein n=1 Tax=Salinicoccus sp. HZC-1 TaxID=3385497 RepID=UPI00398B0B00